MCLHFAKNLLFRLMQFCLRYTKRNAENAQLLPRRFTIVNLNAVDSNKCVLVKRAAFLFAKIAHPLKSKFFCLFRSYMARYPKLCELDI